MKKYKYTVRECLNKWLDNSCDYSNLSIMLNEKVEEKQSKEGDRYFVDDGETTAHPFCYIDLTNSFLIPTMFLEPKKKPKKG